MSVRFLTPDGMLHEFLRALAGFVEPKGIDESRPLIGFRMIGADFDAGKERQRESGDFYNATAYPMAAVIADNMGARQVVFGLPESGRGSTVLRTHKAVARLSISNDMLSGVQIGRFDVLFRI